MSGPEAVMEAQDLRRYYELSRGWLAPKATVKALDGVSFTLAPHRTLAVVGESGCGKSTLARQLTLIEPPSSGALRLNGRDYATASEAERRRARRQVQIIFQNPYGSLNPRKKIGAILAEPLAINTDLGSVEREARVREVMAKVGLRPEHYMRYPHMFSGGQRQRVAIARALMLKPRVVVADEPVSALDVSIQAQVLNLLMDLQDELGMAYVFISHDLAVVRHIADDVLVMYLGRPVEQGASAEVFARPLHPYTRALLAAAPSLDPDRRAGRSVLRGELPSPLNPPAGCAFHTRCPHADGECAARRPEPRSYGGREVACHHVERIG
ncbi:dipeptide transport system ATP-binding protein [Plasticicumulans lactativorans]|uniref:Dipeptide transport system ATP-binding protein n=1 Tax=Plasticicumulans lactativorans TaxID=1133106 RepID=A0A4V2SD55_9GAMM|nr:dipeptide ABC transporter ATP-binding protein [Plasticicumulans lactativorans]TCO82006.1 dipeptide transport system ATP-binding protein [Plasticicumulans lactativorans]